MMQEIHSFDRFSIVRSIGGDYYAESANGDILIMSPSGSEEHLRAIEWIEWPGPRTEEEFIREFPEIRQILQRR